MQQQQRLDSLVCRTHMTFCWGEAFIFVLAVFLTVASIAVDYISLSLRFVSNKNVTAPDPQTSTCMQTVMIISGSVDWADPSSIELTARGRCHLGIGFRVASASFGPSSTCTSVNSHYASVTPMMHHNKVEWQQCSEVMLHENKPFSGPLEIF